MSGCVSLVKKLELEYHFIFNYLCVSVCVCVWFVPMCIGACVHVHKHVDKRKLSGFITFGFIHLRRRSLTQSGGRLVSSKSHPSPCLHSPHSPASTGVAGTLVTTPG